MDNQSTFYQQIFCFCCLLYSEGSDFEFVILCKSLNLSKDDTIIEHNLQLLVLSQKTKWLLKLQQCLIETKRKHICPHTIFSMPSQEFLLRNGSNIGMKLMSYVETFAKVPV
jgi:hypothetical protein